LLLVLKVPAAHRLHVLSRAAVPTALTKAPAAQLDQGRQAVALLSALKVPLAQSLQTRSTVAVPVVLTYMPLPQAVQSTQGLAGLES
jgi:hypothetical protein